MDLSTGDDDRACADYLVALLRGEDPAPEPFLRRVHDSAAARQFAPGAALHAYRADVERAADLDVADFAMVAAAGPDGYPVLTTAH